MYNRLETLIDSIYTECNLLSELSEGLTPDTDLGKTIVDVKTFRAICFGEQTIGEAVVQIGHLTQNRLFELYPQINWNDIKGMKNHIVHEYLDIDSYSVLSTALRDIPILKQTISKIKRDIKSNKLNKLLYYVDYAQRNKGFQIPSMGMKNGKNQ